MFLVYIYKNPIDFSFMLFLFFIYEYIKGIKIVSVLFAEYPTMRQSHKRCIDAMRVADVGASASFLPV